MSDKPRKFLSYPAVIDWLQWGEFPEKLGEINYPQVTLALIAEYREAYQAALDEILTLKKELFFLKNPGASLYKEEP